MFKNPKNFSAVPGSLYWIAVRLNENGGWREIPALWSSQMWRPTATWSSAARPDAEGATNVLCYGEAANMLHPALSDRPLTPPPLPWMLDGELAKAPGWRWMSFRHGKFDYPARPWWWNGRSFIQEVPELKWMRKDDKMCEVKVRGPCLLPDGTPPQSWRFRPHKQTPRLPKVAAKATVQPPLPDFPEGGHAVSEQAWGIGRYIEVAQVGTEPSGVKVEPQSVIENALREMVRRLVAEEVGNLADRVYGRLIEKLIE